MSGVITVQLGGQERSLKFGTNSTAKYCEVRKCSLDDYLNDMKFENIKGSEVRDLIFCALWAFNVTNDLETDFNTFTVGDWIDDADQKDINNIFTALADSNAQKVDVKKAKESTKKK